MSQKGQMIEIKKIKIVDFVRPIDTCSITIKKFCNFFANGFLVK